VEHRRRSGRVRGPASHIPGGFVATTGLPEGLPALPQPPVSTELLLLLLQVVADHERVSAVPSGKSRRRVSVRVQSSGLSGRGACGERRRARLLERLTRDGYVVFHDLAVHSRPPMWITW
jgi:hypothetical protein